MAKLSAIADALAAADGRRGSTTISNLARAGREHGLVATGFMAVREAADLLIATMIPLQAATRRDVVAGTAQFRRLYRVSNQVLQGGDQVATLGEALEALIRQAPTLDYRTAVELTSAPFARIVFDPATVIDFVPTSEHPITAGPFRQRRTGDMTIITRCSQSTLLRLHDALAGAL